jgi:uncharacterized lipoprotein (TIGR02269 family)
MRKALKRWGVLLLGLWLAGCAAAPAVRGGEGARQEDVAREEAACEHGDECQVLACGEEGCTFLPCAEVMPGSVVRTRGVGAGYVIVAPLAHSTRRYWGRPVGLPEDRGPVFVIPWGSHLQRPLLPSQQQLLLDMEERARRPHEKHHLFPQQQELKEWFESKGIDIHQYTILIDTELHHRIHKGPEGGPWNAAWRGFKNAHFNATPEEIWAHAWTLCVQFGIYGPLLPYSRRVEAWRPPIEF